MDGELGAFRNQIYLNLNLHTHYTPTPYLMSRILLVRDTGFEPVAFSTSMRRSTN